MQSTNIQEAAALARINLSDQDLEAITPAFDQMLSLFDEMQAADSDASMPAVSSQADFVSAWAQPVSSAFFRTDCAESGAAQADTKEYMLSQAGDRDGNFIVIPNVL